MTETKLYAQQKSGPGFTPVSGGVLQRKCACGGSAGLAEECEGCSMDRLGLQRSTENPELETRNSKPETRDSGGVPPIVNEVLSSSGQPLDSQTRAFFEPRFSHDFSSIRVHTDSRAAESASSVNALAYTVGENIVFSSGTYAPATQRGQHLLAHELTHVLQQQSARNFEQLGGQTARPAQPKLVVGMSGDSYEQEADRVASSLVEGGPEAYPFPISAGASRSVQRQDPPAPTAPPITLVPPVAPNADQQSKIEQARSSAALQTQSAMLKVRGMVPPGRETPAQNLMRVTRLARAVFAWPNPDLTKIEATLDKMVARLTNPKVMVAGNNDAVCEARGGYVVDFSPPIVLCPTFFTSTPEQRIRTLTHESAHLAQVGNALSETYCSFFDCETSCAGIDDADSWAHFIHCLSGQTPDKIPVEEVKPGPPPDGGTP